jgi:hypothetical protein
VFDPLAEKLMYVNFRYLVVVFYHHDHLIMTRLETLRELNLGRCIEGYSDVLPLSSEDRQENVSYN